MIFRSGDSDTDGGLAVNGLDVQVSRNPGLHRDFPEVEDDGFNRLYHLEILIIIVSG